MDKLQTLLKDKQKSGIPHLRAGQVVRVHEKIKEGADKERIQIFEGLVIAVKHGVGLDGTFTVRKIGAGGVGVERIFPLHMPAIEKIEILRQEHVRQGKLYYIRDQISKKTKKRKAKIQNLIFDMGGEEVDTSSTTDKEQLTTDQEEEEEKTSSITDNDHKEEALEPADAQEASEVQENSETIELKNKEENTETEVKVEKIDKEEMKNIQKEQADTENKAIEEGIENVENLKDSSDVG